MDPVYMFMFMGGGGEGKPPHSFMPRGKHFLKIINLDNDCKI